MRESNDAQTEQNAAKLQAEIKQISEGITEKKLPQRAYQILRVAIRDLKLLPNKTILEREIAEILEMSRTPVREALIRLQTEGLVELIPRRGFIVESIEPNELSETYEVVEVLEGLAASLATEKITDEDLQELAVLINKQEIAIQKNNLIEWARLDDLFHHTIIEIAANSRLSNVMEVHADKLYRARLFTIDDRPLPHQSIVEHQAILACMRAKDNIAAQSSMQSHRKRARNEILQVLNQ